MLALSTGTAQASSLLPGVFETSDAVLGTGVGIGDPEGLAIIGDTLYVVDDDNADGGTAALFAIDLNTHITSRIDLGFQGTGSTLSLLDVGTLTPGGVVEFTFIDGAGGLNFAPGDGFIIELDNDIPGATSAPDLTLGTFDAGFTTLLDTDDDSSSLGNGVAPALGGTVNTDGTINIRVSGFPDFDFDGNDDISPTTPHGEAGNFDVFGTILDDSPAGLASRLDDLEGLAASPTSLFLGGEDRAGGAALIVEIDPITGAVLNAFKPDITDPDALTFFDGRLFAGGSDTLSELDPTDGTVLNQSTFSFSDFEIEGLAYDGSALLVGNNIDPESILRVDPDTFAVLGTLGEDLLPITDPVGLAFSETLGIVLSDPDIGTSDFGQIASFQPTAPIPLPAPAWLLLSGLAALALVRRRAA
ncbi:MAG: VPLPA-CTERM sorting domain-containing protein [Pseudomonadota bacterium]